MYNSPTYKTNENIYEVSSYVASVLTGSLNLLWVPQNFLLVKSNLLVMLHIYAVILKDIYFTDFTVHEFSSSLSGHIPQNGQVHVIHQKKTSRECLSIENNPVA